MPDPAFRGLRLLAVAAAVCAAPPPAQAEWLIASGHTRIKAGQPLPVSVVRDPETDAPLADRLPAILEAGERRVTVELLAEEPGPAHGLRRNYVFEWPAGLSGTVVLQLADQPSSRLLVLSEAGPPPSMDHVVEVERPASAAPPVVIVPPEPALTVNEPMYFLLGVNERNARFQLSFKYRLFDAEGPVVEWLPMLGGLHFGYTQTSLWDLGSDSKPFRDTSYRPSLFYRWIVPMAPEGRSVLSLRAGYEHESNGRDGENSRSIDTLFANADWRHRLGGERYIAFTPKVWYFLDKDENSDIQEYRGYGELGVRFGRDDGWLARLNLRHGMGGKRSTQLDLSYPLGRPIFSDVAAYLHFQVFNGYGETLLDYNERHETQYRIGFSILR